MELLHSIETVASNVAAAVRVIVDNASAISLLTLPGLTLEYLLSRQL